MLPDRGYPVSRMSKLPRLLLAAILASAGAARASHVDLLCGDAVINGSLVASDAQRALRTAVDLDDCAECLCDVNVEGGITAGDALLILRSAVGQPVALECAACADGSLEDLRLEVPCTGNYSDTVCLSENYLFDQATLDGDLGVPYDVTVRFRGVVEQKTYVGGEQDGLFLAGGTPGGDGYWAIYRLYVSDPPGSYYLNAGTHGIYRTWLLDVTKTIRMNGGATVTLDGQGFDGGQIKNMDDMGSPIVPEGVPPAPDAFNGQFIQMDVLSVE